MENKFVNYLLRFLIGIIFLIFCLNNIICIRLREPSRRSRYSRSVDASHHIFKKRSSNWSHLDGKVDESLPNDKISCKLGEWDDLATEESIKFAIDKKSCKINILGSKAEKCTASIACTDLNFAEPGPDGKCRENSYLQVYDSYSGGLTVCGKRPFGGPYRARRGGRDLYIMYKGPSKGTSCHVVCAEDRKSSKIAVFKVLPFLRNRTRDSSCVCGKKENLQQGRIVGGIDATPFEFPWLSAIAYKNTRQAFCGGALINDQFIISAAHCFASSTEIFPEDVDVLLHTHVLDLNLNKDYVEGAASGEPGSIADVPGLHEKNYTDADENTIRLQVEDIIVHPLWDSKTLDFDVALLKLKKPVNLGKMKELGINTICLPPQGQFISYANKTAVVAGWGRPSETAGAASRLLQKVEIPVLKAKSCKRMINIDFTPRMMCAGHVEGGFDSCVGDSGGPLITKIANTDDQYRLIGVVSFGIGCARPATPGIYTSIQEVIQWVYHTAEYHTLWCQDS